MANDEKELIEVKEIVDEFADKEIEQPSIVTFTDGIVANKIDEQKSELINNDEYMQKASEIGKASLNSSMQEQDLNVRKKEIDNALKAHEIEIKKHELDIAAKHDFKKVDFEKNVERKISKRQNLAENKASKLLKYADIKEKCKVETKNLFVLAVISFMVAVGDFFKGLTYTFKGFNAFLKSIIVISLIIIIVLSLWYGLDLGQYIRIDSG
ncbi:MAG: hypothetical protein RSB59_03510 [Clostridia bacterium]